EAELGSLPQALLAIVEQRLWAGERAVAGLGDECFDHPAGRRPAGVDRQYGLDEVLIEGRAAQHPTAASLDHRRPVGQGCNRVRRLPIGGEPALHPAQDFALVAGAEPTPVNNDFVELLLDDFYRLQSSSDVFDAGKPAGT